jgi:hypothetical protein
MKNDIDTKALGEAMMETSMTLVKAQRAEEDKWLAGLEKDPSQISVFERGIAVADFKGEAVRQHHLATLAKTENVRAAIVEQAEWCDSVVARLERLALDGESSPTIN